MPCRGPTKLQWPATAFVTPCGSDDSRRGAKTPTPLAVIAERWWSTQAHRSHRGVAHGFPHPLVINDVVGDVRMTLESVRVKRITLNIDPVEARDLLERVPRACIAFTGDEGPQTEPVSVLFKEDRYLVGMLSSAASHPTAHTEVVLLVDDGVQFFDLRAIYVRGHVQLPREVHGLAGDFFWFEVQPTRTVAWDYARMREVDDES